MGSIYAIDLDRLEWEGARQGDLRKDYGDKLADARKILNDAEDEKKLVEAQSKLAVRRNPENYGLEKTTEDMIKAMAITLPEYRQACKDVNEAQHAVDVLAAAVAALDHKKSMIGEEVTLWAGSYFASPRISGDIGKAITEEKDKERLSRISGKLKKRKGDSGD